MGSIYILKISDSYPESYWFKCKVQTGQDPIALKRGEVAVGEWCIEFHLNKAVSVNKVLNYDFFFSDGPNFISPRLYEIMIKSAVTGVQYIDADLFLSGVRYDGYKVVNFTRRASAFDEEKSESEPLLSYLPEGPQKYTKVVLRSDLPYEFDMFRSEEDFTTILAVNRIKEIFEAHDVVGLKFDR